MRNRLTERDLSRIVRHVIKEQEEGDDFCKNAKVDKADTMRHLQILEDIKNMTKKHDKLVVDCDLDAVMSFILMFEPIVEKYNALIQLDIDGIDAEKYIKHLKKKYNI
jgi:hypothetical protein